MCHNGHGYVSVYRNDNAILSLFLTNHIFCSKSNTTSVLCGTGTVYPSGEPEFTPLFSGVRVARALMFCVMFCISFISLVSFFYWSFYCLPFFYWSFYCLPFFYWSFYCLPFFDLQLLITSLVS